MKGDWLAMAENKKIIPKQKAVALKYSPTDIAPKVLAKGQGYMAERILKNAKEHDVAVYKDENLVKELDKLDIGNNIPPELYEVVAQVLVFIDRLDRLEAYKK
jgi:flagellar biosynthesis protein